MARRQLARIFRIGTRFALPFALLLALTAPFAAAEEPPTLDAGPRIEPASVTWLLGADSHDGARLVVSGPDDFYLARSFAAGESPSLSLFDEAGQPFPDGTYAWELTTAPRVDPELREVLRENRKAGREPRSAGLPLPRGERSSGYFAVYGSRFVVPSSAEASEAPLAASGPAAGQEIAERTTYDDELCVGLGCIGTTITFSDSNVVLRDTDTRLKLADTSTPSPFFSSSDWEIEINAADGGSPANYFGLNDCGYASDEGGCVSDLVFAVEAGARQNALYVENDGQVGIGTSNPQRELHLVSADSPALRFDQDGTGAFSAYDWDLAANEENLFFRDVTNNNTVPFLVSAGAAADTLVVDTGGLVGINHSAPEDYLHIRATGSNGGVTIESGGDTPYPQLTLSHPQGLWRLRVNSAGKFVVTDAIAAATPLVIRAGTTTNLLDLGTNTVSVNGNLTVTGVKNFVQTHPEDSRRAFYYAALEGPEAGTYHRGTAKTVDGVAVVELPEAFSVLTEREGMTVQITPIGGDHRFWVEERTPERLVIREASGADGAELDYLVQGVRLGYSDYRVERPAAEAESP